MAFIFCLIMLLAGKPRVSMAGCSVAVSQCLTGGFVLSLSGSPDWKEGYGRGWGLGRRARRANSLNPPVDLGFFLHPPTFSTFVFSFFCIVSLSPLFNHVTDKAGPEDDWAQAQNWRVPAGLSEAATEVTSHGGCA